MDTGALEEERAPWERPDRCVSIVFIARSTLEV